MPILLFQIPRHVIETSGPTAETQPVQTPAGRRASSDFTVVSLLW